jgi:hypothetical protein
MQAAQPIRDWKEFGLTATRNKYEFNCDAFELDSFFPRQLAEAAERRPFKRPPKFYPSSTGRKTDRPTGPSGKPRKTGLKTLCFRRSQKDWSEIPIRCGDLKSSCPKIVSIQNGSETLEGFRLSRRKIPSASRQSGLRAEAIDHGNARSRRGRETRQGLSRVVEGYASPDQFSKRQFSCGNQI